MLKRDFLIAQINKFSEVVWKALFDVENYNISTAEETVRQNYNEELLNKFDENGKLPEDKLEYETLLFQLELLYVRLRISKAKGLATAGLKQKYLGIARNILSSQKDFNLTLQQRIAEVEKLND